MRQGGGKAMGGKGGVAYEGAGGVQRRRHMEGSGGGRAAHDGAVTHDGAGGKQQGRGKLTGAGAGWHMRVQVVRARLATGNQFSKQKPSRFLEAPKTGTVSFWKLAVLEISCMSNTPVSEIRCRSCSGLRLHNIIALAACTTIVPIPLDALTRQKKKSQRKIRHAALSIVLSAASSATFYAEMTFFKRAYHDSILTGKQWVPGSLTPLGVDSGSLLVLNLGGLDFKALLKDG